MKNKQAKKDLTELVGRCQMKEELLTDLVMKLGKEMINQNLPNSTEIYGLITLGEFRTLLEDNHMNLLDVINKGEEN